MDIIEKRPASKKPVKISLCLLLALVFLGSGGCGGQSPPIQHVPTPPRLSQLSDISSFDATLASSQALQVIMNNPYSEQLFQSAFDKVVSNLQENRNPKNLDVIWDNLVNPLVRNGHVPPDLAKRTWNMYFSEVFVSLPFSGDYSGHCYDLAKIKKNVGEEFKLKQKGFEICDFGTVDGLLLDAMYVYNAMWSACNPPR